MRVVQINTVFGTGSTGKIAMQLFDSLKGSGDEAYVAYGRKTCELDRVYSDNAILVGNRVDFVGHVLLNFFAGKSGFGSAGNTRKLISWLKQVKPDIIHLHNLHGFYVNVELLFEYIKSAGIPVVWTFHDCWPFTGQCAHFDHAGCDKWKSGCHDCPIFRSNYPYSLFKDNSRWNYSHKKDIFTGVKDLTIVTPSRWLHDLVKESFLKDYPIEVINNGIDTEVFSPSKDRESFIESHGIPRDRIESKIILGVANIWSKPKGLSYLLRLAEDLKDDPTYFFVIIGLSASQCSMIRRKYPSNVLPLKRTANRKELASWYSAAFAYVNPTLEDTFPTTNLESLSCGTPVITFNTGGSPEALNPGSGVVVKKGDYEALKEAIMTYKKPDAKLCRDQALKYTLDSANKRYLDLYKRISRTVKV